MEENFDTLIKLIQRLRKFARELDKYQDTYEAETTLIIEAEDALTEYLELLRKDKEMT